MSADLAPAVVNSALLGVYLGISGHRLASRWFFLPLACCSACGYYSNNSAARLDGV